MNVRTLRVCQSLLGLLTFAFLLTLVGNVGAGGALRPLDQIPAEPAEHEVLRLTNQQRTALGLPPLSWNEQLTTAARKHSEDMATRGFFDHTNPSGIDAAQRVSNAGYSYNWTGENIASGYPSPTKVMEGWMNSPGHRQNILSPNYRELGVGYHMRRDDPKNMTHYWTQNFGTSQDRHPLVIAGEAWVTNQRSVNIYVYGAEDGATDLQLSINGTQVGEKGVFKTSQSVELPNRSGQHTISAEFSVGGRKITASDTIYLNLSEAASSPTLTVARATATRPVSNAAATLSRATPRSSGDLAGDTPAVIGVSTAPIVIVDFGDYLCSTCRDFATNIFPQLQRDYPNQIFYISRAYPIIDEAKYSPYAAEAALCVAEQRRFEAYHKLLYTEQATLKDEAVFVTLAEGAGANRIAFTQCMSSGRHKDRVTTDSLYAKSQGFSLPTIFINGVKLSAPPTLREAKILIDSALSISALASPPPTLAQGTSSPVRTALPTALEALPTFPSPFPAVTLRPTVGLVTNNVPIAPQSVSVSGTLYADQQIWCLPWYIILPLIVLLLILLLSWLMMRRKGRLWYWNNSIGWGCKLSRTGLVFYPVIMAAIFGYALTLMCPIPQNVFWRIDSRPTSELVSVRESDLSLPLALRGINNQGDATCIGCHAYTEAGRAFAYGKGAYGGPVVLLDAQNYIERVLGVNGSYFAWSVNGQRLVIAVNDADLQIYDRRTGSFTAVVGASDPSVIETMPSWNPANEDEIVFVRHTELAEGGRVITSPTDLYVVSLKDRVARPLVGASNNQSLNYYPTYSPDGKWIAFTQHKNRTTYADPAAQIMVIPSTGGTAVWIKGNEVNSVPVQGVSNTWPRWSPDGKYLSFSTKRQDRAYDIFVAPFAEGDTGAARPLTGASSAGIFEHNYTWGLAYIPPVFADLLPGLYPWLLPWLAFLIAGILLCREPPGIPVVDQPPPPPPPPPPPSKLPPYIPPLIWEPQPTLILGVGESGRHILTHLKKNIRDAGLGKIPDSIQFLSIATGNLRRVRTPEQPQIAFAGVTLSDSELIDLNQDLNPLARADLSADSAYDQWFDAAKLKASGVANLQLAQSTGLNRVLSRAGLIQYLRGNRDPEPDLLGSLKAAMRASYTQSAQTLYVVIVGSTADDGGSLLLDLAYLVRKLKSELKLVNLNIVAHLASDQAIAALAPDQRTFRVNSGATLRELERLQLASELGIPQRYGVPALDGEWPGKPFDAISLYDGSGTGSNSPIIGVYPAIADIIALTVDKASRRERWQQVQLEQVSTHAQEQDATRTLTINSGGIFQYRLPYMDLMDYFRLRYAAELITLLVMGPGGSSTQFGLSVDTVDWVMKKDETANDLVKAFFAGTLPAKAPARQWKTLDDSRATEQLKSALLGAVTRLLNGSGKSDSQIGRTRQLKRTLAFLEQLKSGINAQKESLPSHEEALNALEALRTELTTGLKLQIELIGASGTRPKTLRSLTALGVNIEERRKELDQILCRKLIWEGYDEEGKPFKFHEVWYEKYLSNRVYQDLRQFFWSVEAGSLALTLTTDQIITLQEETLDQFLSAIIELADRGLAELPQTETLSKRLESDLLNDKTVDSTSETLIKNSSAMLSFTGIDAARQQHYRVLIAGAGTTQVNNIQSRLTETVNSDLNRVVWAKTTDPFSLGVLDSQAIIPITAVDGLKAARTAYLAEYGYGEQPANRPILTGVYPTDALAIQIETRFREVQQTPRILNPVIVSGLSSVLSMESFATALFNSDLEIRGNSAYLNGKSIIQPIGTREHPLVEVFVSFGKLNADLLKGYLQTNTLSQVSKADRIEWVKNGWQDWNDAPNDSALQDLLTVVRLLVLSA